MTPSHIDAERPYTAALPFARAAEEFRGEAVRGWRRADLVATFLDQVERGQLTRGPAEAGRSFHQEAMWTGDSRS